MPEIEFHGKKMGMLEAKLYLFGLKKGIISAVLTDDEKRIYNVLKNLNDEIIQAD
jgi:hypothetical protein